MSDEQKPKPQISILTIIVILMGLGALSKLVVREALEEKPQATYERAKARAESRKALEEMEREMAESFADFEAEETREAE